MDVVTTYSWKSHWNLNEIWQRSDQELYVIVCFLSSTTLPFIEMVTVLQAIICLLRIGNGKKLFRTKGSV